jgi:hypothetical protein
MCWRTLLREMRCDQLASNKSISRNLRIKIHSCTVRNLFCFLDGLLLGFNSNVAET